MELREVLFPDSNITGYTDRNNNPILLGQKLISDSGTIVRVVSGHSIMGGSCFGVSPDEDMSAWFSPLNIYMSWCAWVEIVVQEPEHNTASEAIAPFNDKEVMNNSQASDYLHGTHFGPTKPVRKIKRRY